MENHETIPAGLWCLLVACVAVDVFLIGTVAASLAPILAFILHTDSTHANEQHN